MRDKTGIRHCSDLSFFVGSMSLGLSRSIDRISYGIYLGTITSISA